MQDIHAASFLGNLVEVKRLVKDGADPSGTRGSWKSSLGYVVDLTPIVSASLCDHLHVVKYFINECGVGDEEQRAALVAATQRNRLRCIAFLSRRGVKIHGPFLIPTASFFLWNLPTNPLAMLCTVGGASSVSCILQENTWTKVEMARAFNTMVSIGKWMPATLLFEAGAPIHYALETALGSVNCPPGLRKMLWAYKISAEKATTVRLACAAKKNFSKCLIEFDDKVALLHGPVTRHMRLQVAMTVTPNPLWQCFLVKNQLPVTAKSSLMSFVLHEHAHGLPDSLVGHIVGFLGGPMRAANTLTGKMLYRRGALVD